MGKVIELNENGTTIWIEGVDVESEGITPVGVGEKIEKGLTELLGVIKVFSNALLTNINQAQKIPDVVRAEFGLGFNGKIGIFIAQLDASANVRVTLEWKNKKNNRENNDRSDS